jgi:hypothetical protein
MTQRVGTLYGSSIWGCPPTRVSHLYKATIKETQRMHIELAPAQQSVVAIAAHPDDIDSHSAIWIDPPAGFWVG